MGGHCRWSAALSLLHRSGRAGRAIALTEGSSSTRLLPRVNRTRGFHRCSVCTGPRSMPGSSGILISRWSHAGGAASTPWQFDLDAVHGFVSALRLAADRDLAARYAEFANCMAGRQPGEPARAHSRVGDRRGGWRTVDRSQGIAPMTPPPSCGPCPTRTRRLRRRQWGRCCSVARRRLLASFRCASLSYRSPLQLRAGPRRRCWRRCSRRRAYQSRRRPARRAAPRKARQPCVTKTCAPSRAREGAPWEE